MAEQTKNSSKKKNANKNVLRQQKLAMALKRNIKLRKKEIQKR